MKSLLILLCLFLSLACSVDKNNTTPADVFHPTYLHPNIIHTQALFKTNASGLYTIKQNAKLEIGNYILDLDNDFIIQTSTLNASLFVFNIINTNLTLTKGVNSIVFTNGVWDGYANFHQLHIHDSHSATLNNMIVTYIEDPSKKFSWQGSLEFKNNSLYFIGTNIALKNTIP